MLSKVAAILRKKPEASSQLQHFDSLTSQWRTLQNLDKKYLKLERFYLYNPVSSYTNEDARASITQIYRCCNKRKGNSV